MRTIRTKVYKFSELSDKAKQKAIEKFYDINVDYDWWESVYEDAENIGLKITGFDLDHNCTGQFTEDAYKVAQNIRKEHGESCETYKTAYDFLTKYDELVVKYSDGKRTNIVAEGNEYDFDNEADDLEADFLKSICEDYRILLRQEYEYRQSKDAIIETIEANEYEFKADGSLF